MKRTFFHIISLICLLALANPLFAQYYESSPTAQKPNRWFFGGNLGFAAGSVTYVEVAPLVGYKLTPKLAVGSGIKYQYFNDSRESYNLTRFETHVYGISVFSTYSLFDNLGETLGIDGIGSVLLHAEYEGLSLERRYFDYPTFPQSGRLWLSSYLLGFGISQPLGERSSVNIFCLWSLDPQKASPYSNPILRIGFNF